MVGPPWEGHAAAGRPYVTAVDLPSSPADGEFYRSGEAIEIELTFDDRVRVEDTPSLIIRLDGVERLAEYQSGSGSERLLFSYRVQPGDSDSNGFKIPDPGASQLQGGRILRATDTSVEANLNLAGHDNVGASLPDHRVKGSGGLYRGRVSPLRAIPGRVRTRRQRR